MKKAALWIVGILIVIQLIPVQRTNPPVTADIEAPEAVKAILKTSCYDCHSHESTWPWYSKVAPVSWLVVHDVNEGREELNFSTWGELPVDKQHKALEESIEEIEEGEMPMPVYLLTHKDATVTDAQLATLKAWVLEVSQVTPEE